MRRRTTGDMAKARSMPKKAYPYKNAPFDWQIEYAYKAYQEYKRPGSKVITTDEQAFRAGIVRAFGWIQDMLRPKKID